MPDDYFEDFLRLTGGPAAAGTGEPFRGGLVRVSAWLADPDGIPAAVMRFRLTHTSAVVLKPGDWVRRVCDGADFCVTGDEPSARTPAFSEAGLAMTMVERTMYGA